MLANNTLSVAKIDESLARIFVPMFQLGLFDKPNPHSSTNDVTTAEHTSLARELSAQSHVLLKNDGDILPLRRDAPLKIALVGHHARAPITGGGGSGSVSTEMSMLMLILLGWVALLRPALCHLSPLTVLHYAHNGFTGDRQARRVSLGGAAPGAEHYRQNARICGLQLHSHLAQHNH